MSNCLRFYGKMSIEDFAFWNICDLEWMSRSFSWYKTVEFSSVNHHAKFQRNYWASAQKSRQYCCWYSQISSKVSPLLKADIRWVERYLVFMRPLSLNSLPHCIKINWKLWSDRQRSLCFLASSVIDPKVFSLLIALGMVRCESGSFSKHWSVHLRSDIHKIVSFSLRVVQGQIQNQYLDRFGCSINLVFPFRYGWTKLLPLSVATHSSNLDLSYSKMLHK